MRHAAQDYPVPFSFARVQPRFPGQLFDTYTQKSNNLQIWNEEIVPSRRYVIVRVADDGKIVKVKVVTGQALALFDTTGTLTRKYQARLIPVETTAELISREDTDLLKPFVKTGINLKGLASPVSYPVAGELIPISELFERLTFLVNQTFPDPGSDQERNRGADLHRLVCQALGYDDYRDDGQFPDIPHQLLEVKLQTSPTFQVPGQGREQEAPDPATCRLLRRLGRRPPRLSGPVPFPVLQPEGKVGSRISSWPLR